MRGYSTGPMLRRDFFIIMDRLYETLDQRIQSWGAELHPHGESGILKTLFGCRGGSKEQNEDLEHTILLQRFMAAYDLASAFTYMHQNK